MNLFVTGTDTGVGKTVVSAVLIDLLKKNSSRIAYYKPIQTGAIIDGDARLSEDALAVGSLTGISDKSSQYCSYILTEPMSPYQSALKDGVEISIDKILSDYNELSSTHDHVIIEGAGGLYVPITETVNMLDLIERMNAKVILVTRPGLGTINHSVLSIKALQTRELDLLGYIVNKYPQKEDETMIILENPEMITKFTNVKCLAKVMKSDLPQLDYRVLADFIL